MVVRHEPETRCPRQPYFALFKAAVLRGGRRRVRGQAEEQDVREHDPALWPPSPSQEEGVILIHQYRSVSYNFRKEPSL